MINRPDIKFYDTSSLLAIGKSLIISNEKFLVSSITFQQLENCEDKNAKFILKLLNENPNNYDIIWHTEVNKKDFPIYVDDNIRILSDAFNANNTRYIDEVIFVTNNIVLKSIANYYFGDDMIKLLF